MYMQFKMEGHVMAVETFQNKDGEAQCRVVLGFIGSQVRLVGDPNRHLDYKPFINKLAVCEGSIDHSVKTFGDRADERFGFNLEKISKPSEK